MVGCHRSFNRLQQRLGVSIGDGENRNLHNGGGVFNVEALGTVHSTIARREGVPGKHGHVHNRAPLDAVCHSVRALGIDIPAEVTVILGIGVDDAADSPFLICHFRLDAAPGTAVTGDDNLPFHIDAVPLQHLIIGRDAVIHIDQFGGHITIGGEGVVPRKKVLSHDGGSVRLQLRLSKGSGELLRFHHFQNPHFRNRQQDVELLDLSVVPPRLKLGGDELGILLTPGRTDMVRSGRHVLHPVTKVFAVEV